MSPTRFRCANSLRRQAPVAQLAARGSHNPEVASSILVWSKSLLFVLGSPGAMCSNTTPALPRTPTSRLAQLVERKTLNLVVVGSSPTEGKRVVTLSNSGEKVSLDKVKLSAWVPEPGQRGET